jgi:hypothetical protein
MRLQKTPDALFPQLAGEVAVLRGVIQLSVKVRFLDYWNIAI